MHTSYIKGDAVLSSAINSVMWVNHFFSKMTRENSESLILGLERPTQQLEGQGFRQVTIGKKKFMYIWLNFHALVINEAFKAVERIKTSFSLFVY